MRRTSMASRSRRSSSRSSRSWNTSASPNTEAVSAVVSGVWNCRYPRGAASSPCTPWPSSWARVITSARLPLVVEQQVGVDGRHAGMAEGAAALARADRGVDPGVVEEARGLLTQAAAEAPVGRQHHLHGVVPVVAPGLGGERRVAVVVEQLADVEQPALEPVVALDDVVAADHGGDQRVDDGVVDLVVQVAVADPGREAAHAVLGRLVGQQGVEHEGRGGKQRPQPLGDRGRGALPERPVGLVELVQEFLALDLRTVELELRRAVHLVEVADPCAPARDRLLAEHALLGLRQQVRPGAPGDAQEMAVVLDPVVGQQRVGLFVFQGRPLQLEEQQGLVQASGALGELLQQRAALRVAGVRRPRQVGVGARPAGPLQACLVAFDQAGQPGGVEPPEAATVVVGQLVGLPVCRVQVAVERRVVGGGVQVGKVPADGCG